ncbi:MAG: CopG family transcriptional regulator / antitoxin EndoAI [Dehalococcoidia bacterium]|nr:CopG family transcriptional regulator / antitoxin EndoAI [Dehalococcoidia bacterium]
MRGQHVAKVTVSISKELLDFADSMAKEESISRSEVIAKLIKKEEKARIEALMAEGYREMAEENRQEAEEWLEVTREVALRDD